MGTAVRQAMRKTAQVCDTVVSVLFVCEEACMWVWWIVDGILLILAHQAANNAANWFYVMYTPTICTITSQDYAIMPGLVVVDLLGLQTILLDCLQLLSCTSDNNVLRYVC